MVMEKENMCSESTKSTFLNVEVCIFFFSANLILCLMKVPTGWRDWGVKYDRRTVWWVECDQKTTRTFDGYVPRNSK